MKKGLLVFAVFVAGLAWGSPAKADPLTVTATGSDSDGPLAASITFTPVAGGIQIVVTNLATGPLGKGQAVSGFTFSVSGIGTPTAFTELKGRDEDSSAIGSGGTWNSGSGVAFDTVGAGPAIDHWGFAPSGSTV